MKGEELLSQRNVEHRARALGQPLKSLDEVVSEVCFDQPTQQWVPMMLPSLSGANLCSKIRVLAREGLTLVDIGSAKTLLDVESFPPTVLKMFKPVTAMLAADCLLDASGNRIPKVGLGRRG